MTEPRKIVHHFTDYSRTDGDWTMCGIPLPPYAVGPALVCEDCREKLRRFKRQAVDPNAAT